jgi:hypothetical protein
MNTDELIERIHNENATLRKPEHRAPQRSAVRVTWRIAIPAAVAAAILLIVLLPRERAAVGSSGNTTYASVGIYCNSQCNPDDVLALIDNNINHIKTIQSL